MMDLSVQKPLLPGEQREADDEHRPKQGVPLLFCSTRWLLKLVIWGVFVTWIALIFLWPSESSEWIYTILFNATKDSVFGLTGSVLIVFSAPVVLVAVLGYAYLGVFAKEDDPKRKKWFHLWTLPVLVDGPFGVVSAAELIGMICFSLYVLWAVLNYAVQIGKYGATFESPLEARSEVLQLTGRRLGSIGLFCLAFLFLPVARGSALLRLFDIPFEQAVRYHVWLGHLIMVIFTLHGMCFTVEWVMQGTFLQNITEWKSDDVAHLAGVISFLAGVFMWVTSYYPLRRKYFELFFYTHQLYVVFVIFLAMHVGDLLFSFAAGGIFLFVLDRFLRFCQCQSTVDVISASCLPCGTIKLALSKPIGLRYNALSFIFLRAQELSWLQWHPFSVSSSPLEGGNHITIVIKALGGWTEKLRQIISNSVEKQITGKHFQSGRITASVEGPYGHEQAYHLMYENLILIAGGIGITPFLAVLSDLFLRFQKEKPCPVKNVLVIWAVKKCKELSLISSINMHSASSIYDKLSLEIQTYVTQETGASLESGKVCEDQRPCSAVSMTRGRSMSGLVGTGNTLFAGAYLAISTAGFIVIYGLSEWLYIGRSGVFKWLTGLLLVTCMAGSAVIFGGLVVCVWNSWENKRYRIEKDFCSRESNMGYKNEPQVCSELDNVDIMSNMATHYGRRPDFQEIFTQYLQRIGSRDVGVIVCGPPTLQSSVARECMSRNIRGRWKQPIIHFHSHSFDL